MNINIHTRHVLYITALIYDINRSEIIVIIAFSSVIRFFAGLVYRWNIDEVTYHQNYQKDTHAYNDDVSKPKRSALTFTALTRGTSDANTLNGAVDIMASISPGHHEGTAAFQCPRTIQFIQIMTECLSDGEVVISGWDSLIEHTRWGDSMVETTTIHDTIPRVQGWTIFQVGSKCCSGFQVEGSEVVIDELVQWRPIREFLNILG